MHKKNTHTFRIIVIKIGFITCLSCCRLFISSCSENIYKFSVCSSHIGYFLRKEQCALHVAKRKNLPLDVFNFDVVFNEKKYNFSGS